MAETLHMIGGGLAIAGAILTLLGAIGVLRFPDVYTRIHAASITDTGGASLMLLGLGLISGLSLVTLKLVVIWAFIMLASPVAAHALANAAYTSGHAPWTGAYRVVRGTPANQQGPGKPGPRRP